MKLKHVKPRMLHLPILFPWKERNLVPLFPIDKAVVGKQPFKSESGSYLQLRASSFPRESYQIPYPDFKAILDIALVAIVEALPPINMP